MDQDNVETFVETFDARIETKAERPDRKIMPKRMCRMTRPAVGLTAAEAAVARNDTETALAILATLERQFPNEPEPLSRASQILADAERYAEADAALQRGRLRFPANVGFAIARAHLAPRSGNRVAKTIYGQRCVCCFRTTPLDHGGAAALRESGQPVEAEVIAAAGMKRFPAKAGMAQEHARAALARRDFAEAAARSHRAIEKFPNDIGAYLDAALASREMRQFDEAEGLLGSAIIRFPNHVGPLRGAAASARTRGLHFMLADGSTPQRLCYLQEQIPDQADGYTGGAEF